MQQLTLLCKACLLLSLEYPAGPTEIQRPESPPWVIYNIGVWELVYIILKFPKQDYKNHDMLSSLIF